MQLAVLHFNKNRGRVQATMKHGEARYDFFPNGKCSLFEKPNT